MIELESHTDKIGKFINDKFECYLLEENILYFHFFRSALIEIDDAKLGLEVGTKMSPSDETKLIIHMDKYVEIRKETREYLQNNMRTLKAEAHVIPSLAYKILFNLFLSSERKKHALKAFDTLDAALIWIKNI